MEKTERKIKGAMVALGTSALLIGVSIAILSGSDGTALAADTNSHLPSQTSFCEHPE